MVHSFPTDPSARPIAIGIRGLQCHGKHGVYQEEKVEEQPFSIDGSFYFDGARCLPSDRITDSINYSTLARFIQNFVKNSSFNLLETLADRLACNLWTTFPELDRIQITITKSPKSWADEGTTFSATVDLSPSPVILGLGSNLGDRKDNLERAIRAIGEIPLTVRVAESTIHETAPLIVTDQADFLNQCLLVRTILSPFQLLEATQKIEAHLGRVRLKDKGPRTIDIDLLLFGGQFIDGTDLRIPHPDLAGRRFWIEELAQFGIQIEPRDGSVIGQRCRPFAADAS